MSTAVQQPPVHRSLEEATVAQIEVTGAALEKAAAALQAHDTLRRECQALIPEVSEAALLAGLVEAEEKTALDRALLDHKQVLMLFKFAAERVRAINNQSTLPARQVDRDGQLVTTKQASARKPLIPVGGRRGEDTESNLNFDRTLGLI